MSEELAPWLPFPEGTPDSVRPIAGMSHPRFCGDVETTLMSLRDRGIATMISLERFTGTTNSNVWTYPECYHVNLDVPDFEPPTREHIQAFFAAVEERSDGSGIVVHCRAGVGRTGTMLALYLVWYTSLSADEAIDWVRQHRNPRSLETVEQAQCVRDFAAEMNRATS